MPCKLDTKGVMGDRIDRLHVTGVVKKAGAE